MIGGDSITPTGHGLREREGRRGRVRAGIASPHPPYFPFLPPPNPPSPPPPSTLQKQVRSPRCTVRHHPDRAPLFPPPNSFSLLSPPFLHSPVVYHIPPLPPAHLHRINRTSTVPELELHGGDSITRTPTGHGPCEKGREAWKSLIRRRTPYLKEKNYFVSILFCRKS